MDLLHETKAVGSSTEGCFWKELHGFILSIYSASSGAILVSHARTRASRKVCRSVDPRVQALAAVPADERTEVAVSSSCATLLLLTIKSNWSEMRLCRWEAHRWPTSEPSCHSLAAFRQRWRTGRVKSGH